MKNEPAVKVGTYTAVVAALLTLLTAFGLNLSDAQTAAVLGFVAVVAPLVAAFITRRHVTPVK